MERLHKVERKAWGRDQTRTQRWRQQGNSLNNTVVSLVHGRVYASSVLTFFEHLSCKFPVQVSYILSRKNKEVILANRLKFQLVLTRARGPRLKQQGERKWNWHGGTDAMMFLLSLMVSVYVPEKNCENISRKRNVELQKKKETHTIIV